MSHFSLIVTGANIEDQLAPFNEQPEDDDPAVELEFKDQTDEFRAEYDNETVEIIVFPNGDEVLAHTATDEQREDPKGTRVRVPFRRYYESFELFCDAWHSTRPDENGKYGYYYNPKAKWDWWVIGGRWTGLLKAKPGVVGVGGAPNRPGYYDRMQCGNVDFEGMMQDAANAANAAYSKYEAATKGLEAPKPWNEFRKEFGDNIDAAREAYNAFEYIKAVRKAGLVSWGEDPGEKFRVSREEYVEQAKYLALAPYAILHEGEWIARGEMGWFGISNDDVSDQDWAKKATELLLSLPEDTLITVVDCHI